MASPTTGNLLECIKSEVTLKREKVRLKTIFTRARKKLLSRLEENSPRSEVKDASKNLDVALDDVIQVIDRLSNVYLQVEEFENIRGLISEIEKIQDEYARTTEAGLEYLENMRSDRGSLSPENETIVEAVSQISISERLGLKAYAEQNTEFGSRCSAWAGFEAQPKQNQHNTIYQINRPGLSNMGQAVTTGNASPSIGQDLWRQLKRVEIPVFSGDKKFYQNWRAAFVACIDNAPATSEYKLLQLRQYLSGNALQVIENLGHSAAAYEAAKGRLERKYGGRRRQIALYLEELEQFEQVRYGEAGDLEKFADLLDIAIINLQEAGQFNELGNGSLLTQLQRKLPETLLAQYHRWVFENREQESVMSLRTWVIQEAEFQIIAAETVHGLTGKSASDSISTQGMRYRNQRTLFGDARDNRRFKGLNCRVCKRQHGAWNCIEFKDQSVSDRWDIAKRYQLCYRCLGVGHVSKFYPRSRQCGKNGCKELHHMLLHRKNSSPRNVHRSTNAEMWYGDSHATTESPVCSPTEGKNQTTMLTQKQIRSDIVLRTVPVILTNGNRSITVNALLDDASTITYINSDVASELGCKGRTEKTVYVLNGQVETFETRPVEFAIKSVTGNVHMKVSAYTANKVTGTMKVVELSIKP